MERPNPILDYQSPKIEPSPPESTVMGCLALLLICLTAATGAMFVLLGAVRFIWSVF